MTVRGRVRTRAGHPPRPLPNVHERPAYDTGSIVFLTTAHLDHTPDNVDPSDLRAMCQGCHLYLGAGHHAVTRAQTLAGALSDAGQLAAVVSYAAHSLPARRCPLSPASSWTPRTNGCASSGFVLAYVIGTAAATCT